MTSCELTALITAVGNAISEGRSTEELTLLSSMFMQLGDTLGTIAALSALKSDS